MLMTPPPLPSTASDADLERLARLADSALRIEARLTPKPGLVDARNAGAHGDMDLHTLYVSAQALAPWWVTFATCGSLHVDAPDAELLTALRRIGRAAEDAMFTATGGINTHKGAVFAFGLLLGCAGRRLGSGRGVDVGVCDDVAALATPLLVDDLVTSAREPVTAGELLYRAHGLTGARGQAASGYATARDVGLVAYREALELLAAQPHLALGPMARDRALLHALLALLAVNNDTNLAHRGGPEAMTRVAARADGLLRLGGALNPHYVRLIEAFDDELTDAGLSPGGTADLLAVTIWLSALPPASHLHH